MTVFKRSSTSHNSEYERLRRAYVNTDVREVYPQEIHLVSSISDVQQAVKNARNLGAKIGVRSGGHSYSNNSLIGDGVLVDTSNLNRNVDYDPVSHEISFGPAVRVRELSEALVKVGRFFPHGHSPTVAAGGFILNGGQGFFCPTWGATVDQWVTKMEVVTPDGQVRIASHTQNADLFWAARGAGLAFFGVLTKIWGRTMPARKMFTRSMTFDVKNNMEDLLYWSMHTSSLVPKWGTEHAIFTHYPERFDPNLTNDDVPSPAHLHLGIFASAYVDSKEEAQALLSPWNTIPASLRTTLKDSTEVDEMTWSQYFDIQDTMVPTVEGMKWQINSILPDPTIPLKQLCKAIVPAMTNLPTRRSVGNIFCSFFTANERDHLCGLPQQYYISTFTQWMDKSLQPGIYDFMANAYAKLYPYAAGMYIADWDPSDKRQAKVKVWTDYGLKRFLEIRAKYDPEDLFPNYKPLAAGSRASLTQSKL
ncbi:hypothetical protein LTR10_022682 [Elasticomyces elasticus]|uniref:FAD-binding PCMH-type domain-containing protein n=1 Tax=Exophiala sideris TaxID=1016849 RepID=A0ABR0JLU7_9EURO|nr:hypothetical protein LTR10_022682 [Elasticomyces elasticus]KAK5036554.1 hypothetical protein LTS07_002281 [Exophiala sideris]KAK5041617.1 hypothetical protein LTR13_002284 [Exophiala sideris]KAK5066937.1 hypothetical protein LTR69_002285 [Exophiala sideris]KAK5184996.1 hypothetical protein LTR44_002842 [Eurotiomycetes sp. CCFEE 6388]